MPSHAKASLFQRVIEARDREQQIIAELNRARAEEEIVRRTNERRFAATIFAVSLLAFMAIGALIGGPQ